MNAKQLFLDLDARANSLHMAMSSAVSKIEWEIYKTRIDEIRVIQKMLQQCWIDVIETAEDDLCQMNYRCPCGCDSIHKGFKFCPGCGSEIHHKLPRCLTIFEDEEHYCHCEREVSHDGNHRETIGSEVFEWNSKGIVKKGET